MLALLTQSETAELLRLSQRTLERLRISGLGPKFIRLGKSKAIRYRPADLEAWLERKLVGSTSEKPREKRGVRRNVSLELTE